ncbi:MAG TPA: DUF1579 family protein [Longimicrobium sp.]|nr:DUF1579 family protein [Longimicrobium sp.]
MSDPGAAPRPGPEHARLAPFVGRWETRGEVLGDGSTPAVEFAGTDEYEWLPGGFFLLHRVDVQMGGERVQALEVIGWDGERGEYVARSYDHRGGEEVMHAALRDGTWTFVGDASRFTGGFGEGGDTLSGRWERREGDRWLPWMDVRLRKARRSTSGEAAGRRARSSPATHPQNEVVDV